MKGSRKFANTFPPQTPTSTVVCLCSSSFFLSPSQADYTVFQGKATVTTISPRQHVENGERAAGRSGTPCTKHGWLGPRGMEVKKKTREKRLGWWRRRAPVEGVGVGVGRGQTWCEAGVKLRGQSVGSRGRQRRVSTARGFSTWYCTKELVFYF